MGLFTTYKGLENEQNVKYKNIPFNEDNSFNSQPFIQTAPPGDGGGFKVASNVKGFIPKLTSGLTAGALNLTDGLSKTVPSLGAIARGTYRSATDVVRLTKFMATPSGLEFIAKQELLSRMAVQTEISGVSNGGLYNPLATLAQAGVSFAGIHLPTLTNINGEKLFDPGLGYGPIAYTLNKANPDTYIDNRLVALHFDAIENDFTPNPNTLLRYGGGPGSIFGIGSTDIKFATQPDGITPVRTMGPNFIFPEGENKNPGTYQARFREDGKTQYELENKKESIEDRYGLGNPGRPYFRGNIDFLSFKKPITLDTVNAQVIYSSNVSGDAKNKIDEATNDLVTFKIGIIDVGVDDVRTNYMHFRSFIKSFSDSYSSDWSSQTYMGRGEKLYKYNSFDRSINISFTVAAQSRGEMFGMYQKLNYLASTVTPQYTDYGYMTGNIAKLTVGNYVREQYGKIDSISYEIPEESPWLVDFPIVASSYSKEKTDFNELPFIIEVQLRFTPIHNFIPQLTRSVLSGNIGDQRYIGFNSNNVNTIPVAPPPTSKDDQYYYYNPSTGEWDDIVEIGTPLIRKPLYYSPKQEPIKTPSSTSTSQQTSPINQSMLSANPSTPQRFDTTPPPTVSMRQTSLVNQSMMSVNNSTPPPQSKPPTQQTKSVSPKNRSLFKPLKGLFKPKNVPVR